MKKLYIIMLFPLVLLSQSFLISNIPLPKTYILNLDPYPCDEICLQEYLDNNFIFSFLAHADKKLDNQAQDEVRMISISIFNLGSQISSNKLNIALLLPYKTIGRYAASTTNATFAYLMAKNNSFELKSYKVEDESVEEIRRVLKQISDDGFHYIIAPMTLKGANSVSIINPEMNIYFPTINKKDVNSTSSYLYYGGIDYRAQIDLLLKEAVSPLVIFHDKSSIGKKLSLYEEEEFMFKDINTTTDINTTEIETFGAYIDINITIEDDNRSVVKFSIPRRTTNLENQLSENENIIQGSFFINTPIVKTGMIMSQLTLYDVNATNILSTQTNYDPLILSMTQFEDRKSMIIANSITQNNNIIIETNSLLGNDIVYDWINYTTTVGIDLFFNHITNQNREYNNIDIKDNQMIYPIELLQPSLSRFIKHTITLEE